MKVKILYAKDYETARLWCRENLGPIGELWDSYFPPWEGYGIKFEHLEDYTLFMLTIGSELKLKEQN